MRLATTENKIFILTMKQLITELMRKADVPIHCDFPLRELHQYQGNAVERERRLTNDVWCLILTNDGGGDGGCPCLYHVMLEAGV